MTYAMHKLRVILRWSFVYICYSGIINLNEKRYLPTIFGAPNSLPLVPPGREGTLSREHHPLPLDGCPALMVLGKLKTFALVHCRSSGFLQAALFLRPASARRRFTIVGLTLSPRSCMIFGTVVRGFPAATAMMALSSSSVVARGLRLCGASFTRPSFL